MADFMIKSYQELNSSELSSFVLSAYYNAYDYLYRHDNEIPENDSMIFGEFGFRPKDEAYLSYDEALDIGVNILKNGGKSNLIQSLINLREMDSFTSEREVAALGYTIHKMGLEKECINPPEISKKTERKAKYRVIEDDGNNKFIPEKPYDTKHKKEKTKGMEI